MCTTAVYVTCGKHRITWLSVSVFRSLIFLHALPAAVAIFLNRTKKTASATPCLLVVGVCGHRALFNVRNLNPNVFRFFQKFTQLEEETGHG
jgi:hypothetical protein